MGSGASRFRSYRAAKAEKYAANDAEPESPLVDVSVTADQAPIERRSRSRRLVNALSAAASRCRPRLPRRRTESEHPTGSETEKPASRWRRWRSLSPWRRRQTNKQKGKKSAELTWEERNEIADLSRAYALEQMERRRMKARHARDKGTDVEAGIRALDGTLEIFKSGPVMPGLQSIEQVLDAYFKSASRFSQGKKQRMRAALSAATDPERQILPEMGGFDSAADPASLDTDEWIEFQKWLVDQIVLEAFSIVDLSASGRLSAEDLMVLLVLLSSRSKQSALGPDDVLQIVREFDISGDGEIDHSEFLRMVRTLEFEAKLDQGASGEGQTTIEKLVQFLVADPRQFEPRKKVLYVCAEHGKSFGDGPALNNGLVNAAVIVAEQRLAGQHQVTLEKTLTGMDGKPLPHLVIHCDVNNTIIIRDPVSNQNQRDLLSSQLAGCAWGVRIQRVTDEDSWVLVDPAPKVMPPWPGLVSYAEFVSDSVEMPKKDDSVENYAEAAEAVKQERKRLLRIFCDAGEPGEAFGDMLDYFCSIARGDLPDVSAEDRSEEQSQSGEFLLLPSFYHMLYELTVQARSFTLVFRTFGVDIDERLEDEFNSFCEGKHPLFPEARLDGSDGGADHRIDMTDAASVGAFFRDMTDDTISLIWGTHEQPPPGHDLSFYRHDEIAKVVKGTFQAARSLEERVLDDSRSVAIRDYYPAWAEHGYSGKGGKPLFITSEEESIFHIFFDDNIRPTDPTIVDVLDERLLPERPGMARVYDVHLVKATPLRSIQEPQYFYQELVKCEAIRDQQRSRRCQVARMLHDIQAVKGVIEILRGPKWTPELALRVKKRKAGEPEEEDEERLKRTGMKFTPWSEREDARDVQIMFDDEYEEGDLASPQGRTREMRWRDGDRADRPEREWEEPSEFDPERKKAKSYRDYGTREHKEELKREREYRQELAEDAYRRGDHSGYEEFDDEEESSSDYDDEGISLEDVAYGEIRDYTSYGPPFVSEGFLHSEFEGPVKDAPQPLRHSFLKKEWEPFTDALKSELKKVRKRKARGISFHEIMPPQWWIIMLSTRCYQLTERWHGKGNYSAIYHFLMEASEYDGHSHYLLTDLKTQRSEDGYVKAIDGSGRRRILADAASKAVTSNSLLVGRIPQAIGETHLDNLVLSSLVTRRRAIRLRAGNLIQQWFGKTVRRTQIKILERARIQEIPLEEEDVIVLYNLGHNPPEGLTEKEKNRLPNPNCLGFRHLLETHEVIHSYGELPEEARNKAEAFLYEELAAEDPEDSLDEELEAFVKHCEAFPGRSFQGNKVVHKLMLLRAIESPALRILFRSEVERYTQHRYFTMKWKRSLPLLDLPLDPRDKILKATRLPDTSEASRFRKHTVSCADMHGISQTGGGSAEGEEWPPGTLMYELGTLLCHEEHHKAAMTGLHDIEKIIREAIALNPHGGTGSKLPWEELFDVGQNPALVAGKGALTAHTEVFKSSAGYFPLMKESKKPQYFKALDVHMEVIQVGNEKDAVLVQVKTKEPDFIPLLRVLLGLRVRCLQAYGRGVDFTASCTPSQDGFFYINLAPVVCLRRVVMPQGLGYRGGDYDIINPDTSQRASLCGLPDTTVDLYNGKGNVITHDDDGWRSALEGRPMLARLYDFNRKIGARYVCQDFLNACKDSGFLVCMALRAFGVLGYQVTEKGEMRHNPRDVPGPKVAVLAPGAMLEGGPVMIEIEEEVEVEEDAPTTALGSEADLEVTTVTSEDAQGLDLPGEIPADEGAGITGAWAQEDAWEQAPDPMDAYGDEDFQPQKRTKWVIVKKSVAAEVRDKAYFQVDLNGVNAIVCQNIDFRKRKNLEKEDAVKELAERYTQVFLLFAASDMKGLRLQPLCNQWHAGELKESLPSIVAEALELAISDLNEATRLRVLRAEPLELCLHKEWELAGYSTGSGCWLWHFWYL
eukprot:TRINITY_DN15818_c0_g1_i1.p1 TRINITY_DN15818_c0_g1~~TRINITY_DN15818_c0_g1_i1.p1  ORF type:complete len:1927 (-),score=360.69 TRINITY_DN15818_c0_g1_i1:513-6293(-)